MPQALVCGSEGRPPASRMIRLLAAALPRCLLAAAAQSGALAHAASGEARLLADLLPASAALDACYGAASPPALQQHFEAQAGDPRLSGQAWAALHAALKARHAAALH